MVTANTKVNLAYMAGMFDGEGCIGITSVKRKDRPHKSYRLYCKLGMCNPHIPQLFRFNFGGALRHYQKESHRIVWDWSVSNDTALEFLQILLPYLRLKRNEAELAFQFRDGMKNSTLGRKGLCETDLVIREAQKILMSKMKDKTKEEVI